MKDNKTNLKKKIIFIVGIIFFICTIISIYVIFKNNKKENSSTDINNSEISNNKTNEIEEVISEEANNEIYGYINSEETGLTYTTLYNIDYQNEIEDLDKAKNLILKELKNDKEIKFEGIGYLYFDQFNKIYIAKINSDTGNKFFVVYKEEGNFKCKKLTNFYYAYTTLVPENTDSEERNILMDNCEEFMRKSEIGISAYASQDGFMGFVNALDKLLFSKDKKILRTSFKENSTLIRNVENEFLIDNNTYNEKSDEEKLEENIEYSKKEIKLVTPSISSKQINSETSFDETSDLTEFGKELSKIENPIISFAFNVPQNIDREKSQLTLTLKEITSSKEYTVVYNRVDGVMLHNGENTFELTIKDQYGNKRIIKNTIVIN